MSNGTAAWFIQVTFAKLGNLLLIKQQLFFSVACGDIAEQAYQINDVYKQVFLFAPVSFGLQHLGYGKSLRHLAYQ